MGVPVVPQTADAALRVVKSTAPAYVKDFSNLTLRKRLWMALIRKYGRIMYNMGSHTCVWSAKIREGTPQAIGPNPSFSYAPDDRTEQFYLPWRGYGHTGSLDKMEQLMNANGGAAKLWDLLNQTTEDLTEDFARMWNKEIYVDGEAAGNELRYHGRGTFLKYKAGMTANDRVAQPYGSYAGQSIELGDLGGTCTDNDPDQYNTSLNADWPNGQYSPEFDATSPLIMNWSSDEWEPSGKTDWGSTAPYVLSFSNEIQAARGARRARTGDSSPIVALMTPKMKNEFEMKQRELFQINVVLQEAAELGFPEVYKYNGMYLAADFDCPVGEMHQISPGTMEWAILNDQLFTLDGPEYITTQMKYVWTLYNYGNFRFQPKCEAMAKAIA